MFMGMLQLPLRTLKRREWFRRREGARQEGGVYFLPKSFSSSERERSISAEFGAL